MGAFLVPVIVIADYILYIYLWVIIISVVMSWLIGFGIINTHNRTVAMIGDALYRLTEPVLRPIRRLLPNFGGLDISPIIVILIIWLIQAELQALIPVVYRW
jgi:YggT family protein